MTFFPDWIIFNAKGAAFCRKDQKIYREQINQGILIRYTITEKLLKEARKKEFPSDPEQIRRYWARLIHDFGPAALSFLANPRLWKDAPNEKLGQTYIPLSQLPLGLGECRIVFAFTHSADMLTGIRQDGFVLTCRWRSDAANHSRALPSNIVSLADKIRGQFGIHEFWLWPADCFENTDFSDPDLTGDDSIVQVGSAWISLASGLLLAKRQIVPSKNVFASIQYDFDNHQIAPVDFVKNKISVIADFAPTLFYIDSNQICTFLFFLPQIPMELRHF
ncbi:MAG: hypothetical protein Q4G69_11785, partial [Planctomycetia bacterium]|nr:hypothetical protein [Planctomycetia bacterium]